MSESFLDKFKKIFNGDYDDYSGEEYSTESDRKSSEHVTAVHASVKSRGNLDAIASIQASSKPDIVICRVYGFPQLANVGNLLKQNKCVIVNLEGAERNSKVRLEDYLLGFSSATGSDRFRLNDDMIIFSPPTMILTKPPKTETEGRSGGSDGDFDSRDRYLNSSGYRQ